MRNTSLKLSILALVAVAFLAATAPRANADSITATDNGNTFTIDYTLSGGVLTITDFTLNGAIHVNQTTNVFMVTVAQAADAATARPKPSSVVRTPCPFVIA